MEDSLDQDLTSSTAPARPHASASSEAAGSKMAGLEMTTFLPTPPSEKSKKAGQSIFRSLDSPTRPAHAFVEDGGEDSNEDEDEDLDEQEKHDETEDQGETDDQVETDDQDENDENDDQDADREQNETDPLDFLNVINVDESAADPLDFLRAIDVGESAADSFEKPSTASLAPLKTTVSRNLRTLRSPVTPETPSIHLTEQTLRDHGWPVDTLILMQKLHHRGREPILPGHWAMDFPYLPDALFTEVVHDEDTEDHDEEADGDEEEDEEEEKFEGELGEDEGADGDYEQSAPPTEGEDSALERAFIQSFGYGTKTDFHATKALTSLFRLPSRARDRLQTHLRSETLIECGIQAYVNWAYADAALTAPPSDLHSRPTTRKSSTAGPTMPALVLTHTAPLTLNSHTLEQNISDRLANLRQAWIDYFAASNFASGDPNATVFIDEPPTVYAVVILHTNVAVVAYAGAGLRQVGHFDLGQADYDVWNSLAFAVLAVHVRNVACAVWEIYVGEDEEEEKEEDEGTADPDL